MTKKQKNIIFSKVGYLLAAVFLFKYCAGFLLSTATAAVVASISLRVSGKLFRDSKKPRKISAVVLAILIFAFIAFSVSLVIKEIYGHAADFCAELLKNTEKLSEFVESVSAIPFRIASKITGETESSGFYMILSAVKKAAEELIGKIPLLLTSAAAYVPKFIFYSTVTVLMSIYLCADGGRVIDAFASIDAVKKLKRAVPSAAGAYGIIFLLTFAELFLGFSVIGVKFAFTAAVLTSFVDALPVFGTGAVLIPWAAAELFSKNAPRAVALIALWAVMTVVRQIAEPKLVGDGLGISPLMSLASMCLGFCLFGAAGAVVAPFAAVAATIVIKEKPHEAPA